MRKLRFDLQANRSLKRISLTGVKLLNKNDSVGLLSLQEMLIRTHRDKITLWWLTVPGCNILPCESVLFLGYTKL